ncbi:MAG: YqaA family protein [Gammaproteobacteria bacterium]
MALFGGLYDRVLSWSRHRHATAYLGALSFAESSFFPIPPDVMLAPMTLAQPHRAWRLALITTIASVLGGIAGYLIGTFALNWVLPILIEHGYDHHFETSKLWFAKWGVLAVLIAGFSPIPYKVFTITAGAVSMSMPLFVAASVVGRGARFFLIAGLIRAGGPGFEAAMRRNIDRVAIGVTVIGVALVWWLKT